MKYLRQCRHLFNEGASDTSYFTPKQTPVAGTAGFDSSNDSLPKLFRPLQIRDVVFQNRIFLSPLCQYSARDGKVTDWHLTHLGGIIQRGPGLSFVEATAILPEGRITPECLGLWDDDQILGLQRVVEFAHSQGQKIGIQLAHAGRKASTLAPWLHRGCMASKQAGGWPEETKAPSAIPYNDKFPQPKEMTLEDIRTYKDAYRAAIKRSMKIGFDVIEIHNAHGYLLHEFLSPLSNHRVDDYGGSWENRTRLTLEVVELAREVMPKGMPLFLRISATDWMEHSGAFRQSWALDDTIRLAKLLSQRGVDLLDISSGGLHPAQKIIIGPRYQVHFARAIKEKLKEELLVGTVGGIVNGFQANSYLEEDGVDAAFVGRAFQKNPGLVWSFADDLGVKISVPSQIQWGFATLVSGRSTSEEYEE